MSLHKILLFIFLLLSGLANAQNKLALVIGIGDYPEESGWCKIHGDNDISIVTEMLEVNGFEQVQILSNKAASKQGIMEALNNLAKKASLGDVVYIHFSGHGQQITDLDGDEPDGYDEAWIPYDACKDYSGKYQGQNHIVDDELFDFLNQLRTKVGDKGKIIVVSDACHSGSGSRGDEDEDVVRGVQERFEVPAERNAGSVKRESTAWLFVSACKAYQNNFEYRDNQGNYHGMLSYLLWENRADMSDVTWQEVMATIDNRMLYVAKYPQQSQREGAPNSIDEKLF
jgi:hypothetical protein